MNRRYAKCPDAQCRRDVAEGRRLAHQVDDESFAAMDAFFKLGYEATEDAIVGNPGEPVLVPPPGVPRFITCEEGADDGFICTDLASATGIPLRAPVYELRRSDEWVEAPNRGVESIDLRSFLEERMERPLTAEEERFLSAIVRHD